MDERDWLIARFEQNRSHLWGVAYRMLGSLSEADDAIQEAWLRLDDLILRSSKTSRLGSPQSWVVFA